MSVSIVKLDNPIQPYAWGSRVAIASLQGRDVPSDGPEAELWIGDHPTAPSRVDSAQGGISLPDWIARDPGAVLGGAGSSLPFLAKVLAAERSLSVQVHPDAEQARRGHAREERAGTPRDRRCYPDANAKHEVLVALSSFEALCGFRVDAEVEAHLPAFPSLSDSMPSDDRPLAVRLFECLQRLDASGRQRLAAEVASFGCGPSRESQWTARLAEQHPGDPLVVAPVLLNPVTLAPGEGLVVRPGTVHSYLSGIGVEVLTRSDNVIRGGLTPKHVDALELARVIVPEAGPAEVVHAREVESGSRAYRTGTPAFTLHVHETLPDRAWRRAGAGVTVLLCVAGEVEVAEGAATLSLGGGEACLVPAGVEAYTLRGTATVFEVSSG